MATHLAVYGTLRRGGRLHHHLGTGAGRARYAGTGTVRGSLHEVAPAARDTSVLDTSYPCLTVGGAGRVMVELYEVLDPALLTHLDGVEGYDPHDLTGSEYHRVRVPVHEVSPAALGIEQAWIYVYARGAPDPTRRIDSGDWIAHWDTDRVSGPRTCSRGRERW
jgi:gamma-glutamylcyclotransferase (GGCT)/AIG2-like uncharacterized protein YtfP